MAEAGASGVQVAFITAPDPECAATIARALVEERLAACVNLLPGVRSIYRY
ncbi:MAG TPA: divalent cation tolerance protein CutA, partial [Myxococcota bacterium]|nr:divalent cation tolerance protein CutA [Myxococcota bacterium]